MPTIAEASRIKYLPPEVHPWLEFYAYRKKKQKSSRSLQLELLFYFKNQKRGRKVYVGPNFISVAKNETARAWLRNVLYSSVHLQGCCYVSFIIGRFSSKLHVKLRKEEEKLSLLCNSAFRVICLIVRSTVVALRHQSHVEYLATPCTRSSNAHIY